MGRVAATGMVLKFVLHNGDRPALCFCSTEEGIGGRAEHAGREFRIKVQTVDALDVRDRRSATMVPDAIEAHKFVYRFFHLASTPAGMDFHIFAPGEVFKWDAEGQYP